MNINIDRLIDDSMVEKIGYQIYNEYNIGEDVFIYFDTLGGYIENAQEIAEIIQILKDNGSKIICKNKGNVMSAATLIWILGDKRVWDNTNGYFLIHNPYLEEFTGDSEKMLEYGIYLQSVEMDLAEQYSELSGTSIDVILERMRQDEPLTLEEIVTYKFATHLITK